MAQPTAYLPATAFLGFELAQPQFPGQEIDVELRKLRTTTDEILANLALIQRDDTELGNETVGIDQLKPELQLVLGVQTGSLVDIINDFLIVNPINLATQVTGTLQAANFPALAGDITTPGGSLATTLATVNANVGTFGATATVPIITVDAKGRITAVSTVGVTATASSAAGSLTGATLAANVLASSLTSVGTLTGGSTGAGFTVALSTATITGTLAAARMPALTGDITTSAGAVATTLATVNANVGSFGSASSVPAFTVNAKGLVTAASATAVVAPAGTLSGATLAAGVTASSLTSVGTLTGLQIAASGYLNFGATAGSGGYGLRDNTGTVQVKNSGGSWVNIPTAAVTQWTTTGSDIYFSTGNVGIGTTAPVRLAHIHGGAGINTLLQFTNATTGAAAGDGTWMGYVDGSDIFYINNQELNIVSIPNGKVGLGTDAPASQLDVRGANANFLSDFGVVTIRTTDAAADNKGGSIALGGVDGYGYGFIKGARDSSATDTGYLAFGTRKTAVGTTERMRIAPSGNVGIGTASPTKLLHMAGQDPVLSLTNTGAGAQEWLLANGTVSANDGIFSIFDQTGGAARISVAPTTGYVGIGNNAPSVRLDVTGSVKWSGDATSTGNLIVKGGKPWTDIMAWGASPTESAANNRSFIQAAVDYMSTTYAGGIVIVPPGTYQVNATINIKSGVALIGANRNCTCIRSEVTGAFPLGIDIDTVAFVSPGGGLQAHSNTVEGLTILGCMDTALPPIYSAMSVKETGAFVHDVIDGIIRDCNLWGGAWGLSNTGVDCLVENCVIFGVSPAGGCVASTGGNWYIRCKIDINAPVLYGFWQQWNGSASAVAENHFEQCDFTGWWTDNGVSTAYPILIDDSGHSSNITVFSGCVIGNNDSVAGVGRQRAQINLQGAKWTSFVGCEIGDNILLGASGGTCSIVGSYGFSGITATGCHGAGNVNISGTIP